MEAPPHRNAVRGHAGRSKRKELGETATQQIAHDSNFPVGQVERSAAPNWVEEIPAERRRHLRIWLLIGAFLTACTLVVGGITRLTESGLSIVDWAPIVGSIPPISDADWQEAFGRYQQYPEYQKLRPDMTLSEFKYIYFWEYLHRMIGRLIGVVFLIPFLWFWYRKYFNRPLLKRVLLLFALGGLQGAMGWYMVSSGLVDRPDVSHYRLAMHLVLAMTIFGFCLWFANDLAPRPWRPLPARAYDWLLRWLIGLGALTAIQIFWGALVAGLNAGFILNTFPLMNGSLLPPNGWSRKPLPINLVENLATVQWTHRVLGTVLLVGALVFVYKVRRDPDLTRFVPWATALAAVIVVQYGLGVTTLLTHVRTPIAALHQVTALVIVAVILTFLHRVVVDARPAPMVADSRM
ncbi:MAG: COX15/CtaA family protein [Thermomicrobiales bacterium]|nr:COX15/CtaA family protein [Thermomicrobiales bacterium]